MDIDRGAPVQLSLFPETVTLTRIRPECRERRYYRIEIWPDLFGRTQLARIWGRIGSSSRMRLDPYPDVGAALDALSALARVKRQRGYQDQRTLPW
jgi:predicted DNA-binding WGR domain protein